MNKKTNRSSQTQASACVCQGVLPMVTDLLRRLGPPEQAQRHFESARIEFLKGIRALIDARIEHVSKQSRRGEKIAVE